MSDAEHQIEEQAGEGQPVQTDYSLPKSLVDSVLEALEADDAAALREHYGELHVADTADLIEQLGEAERLRFIRLCEHDLEPEVFSELEEGVRDQILSDMEPEVLARIVGELESDDAVYLVEDLEEEQRADVLDALDTIDRRLIEQSLEYEDYSAGRMMQSDLVSVPSFWTVGQVIDYMRAEDSLPEEFYEVFVVDPAHKPLGSVKLSLIMGTKRPVNISAIMSEGIRTFTADQKQEDVAYAFNQYHLISAPVVDDAGRLVGMITIDDAMAALDDEAEEDLMLLGGVGDEEISDRVTDIIRTRFPWLLVNLVTAVVACAVISLFEGIIQQVVALAVLMTIVASMGGNAGTQSLTVAVRALATRDLTSANAMRVIAREAIVGLANGIAFALLMGAVVYLWYDDVTLGLVLGLAMVANMVIATLAGTLIPIWLKRIGVDPALASGVFVTTVTDVVGFFVFLGLAALMLL